MCVCMPRRTQTHKHTETHTQTQQYVTGRCIIKEMAVRSQRTHTHKHTHTHTHKPTHAQTHTRKIPTEQPFLNEGIQSPESGSADSILHTVSFLRPHPHLSSSSSPSASAPPQTALHPDTSTLICHPHPFTTNPATLPSPPQRPTPSPW